MDAPTSSHHLEFTAMVYPPEKYVEHNEDFSSSCREFHRTELPDLVKQLNDPNNPLPILCEHEPNTRAGYVAAAKLTPGNGVLVTMRLDTSTEHGRRAAKKVSSGEWAYVSLGHEFLATKNGGGNGQNAPFSTNAAAMQGYDVSKTAKEVSCCALGARNQTAVIERLNEAKWNEAFPSTTTTTTTASGRVNSSAKQRQQRQGDGDAPLPIGIGEEEEAKRGAAATSFKGVLIGQVLASSVSALPLRSPQQQPIGEMDDVVTTEQPAAASEEVALKQPEVVNNNNQESNNTAVAEAAAVTNNNNNNNNSSAPQEPEEIETKATTAAAAAAANGEEKAPETTTDNGPSIDEAMGCVDEAQNRIAELQKQLVRQSKENEEAIAKMKKEEEERQKGFERKQQQNELQQKVEKLRKMMSTQMTGSSPISVKASAAIVEGKMDIDTSSEIVSALEKVSEGYIAASESKKQLTQQLKDMSSAMGVTAVGGEEVDGQASRSVLKRKQQDDDGNVDNSMQATGTVNASADAVASPSLPQHTVDFLAGKISYDDLNEQCERQRVAEARVGVQQLRGSVMASSVAGGGGSMSATVPSHAMAYSQYCAGKSLLPPVDQLRQDCRGAGLKQVFPGVWNDFLSIANSFDKTGVPPYVKQNILRGLNTYEHKRRNGESRLELNDTMPPPPGGIVKDRAARELVA